jgi:hypothetical protein
MDFRSRFGSWQTYLVVFCAAAGLLVFAGPANAFDIAVNATPSTTQAAGHPDLTVQIDRTGTDNEDIRDLYLDLPPGLIGNTTTVGACTDAQFHSDTCPANSLVGSVSADAVATGLTLPPTTGSIYNLDPGPTEAGAIGIVLRPTGSGILLAPVFIRGTIAVQPNGPYDVNLQNVVLNQPRQVFLLPLLGLPIPIDITVNSLTLTLNGAGTLAPNTYFLTNPTSCGEAVFKARAISYLDQEVTKTTSFTPTNCGAVPFDPFFMADFDPPTVNAKTAPITTAGTPANQDPLAQSHIKYTSVILPYGSIQTDAFLAGTLPSCDEANVLANNCPPGSEIATVEATVPVVDPPTFTGKLYRTIPPLLPLNVMAVLEGPRGIRSVVKGVSEFTGEGAQFKFGPQPQVPITSLKVTFLYKINKNLSFCGSHPIIGRFEPHSGGPTQDVTDTYKTTGFGCEYARPKGASPNNLTLVPAFKPCTSANASHGAPLASASCSPPQLASNYLTVGTPDVNGQAPNFTGLISTKVVGESPINPDNGDQADVEFNAHLTDVRNASDLSDYTGELRAVLPLRITDRSGGNYGDASVTTNDVPLAFNIGCAATPGPEGGACNVATSADAVMTDLVTEGQRGVWRLGQVQVFDGGADGDADTTGDNTLFAVQGAFTP